ncbi:uncharacterized protein JN550_010805 [Neoarthrinium moseri]|uniref:uncharacterized protein n=1 Tax=Neoarthrinium moseri TaxID=1658444 RepID=UPI001FDE5E13|nr:uncharacterized protein JN550_010805 [Neoarthrinium moseri]KAI1861425.1 hypothetical protein JN550_010805 [Neoarthrinium moseri]
MFSKSILNALLLALPALASAVALPAQLKVPEISKRIDACSNYHPMTLGRLVLHNSAPIAAYVRWSYTDTSTWAVLPGGDVLAGAEHTYTRNGDLSVIQRNRQFYLQVCDDTNVIGYDCVNVEGYFNIPANPNPSWEAKITVEDEGLISFDPVCDVTGPV